MTENRESNKDKGPEGPNSILFTMPLILAAITGVMYLGNSLKTRETTITSVPPEIKSSQARPPGMFKECTDLAKIQLDMAGPSTISLTDDKKGGVNLQIITSRTDVPGLKAHCVHKNGKTTLESITPFNPARTAPETTEPTVTPPTATPGTVESPSSQKPPLKDIPGNIAPSPLPSSPSN